MNCDIGLRKIKINGIMIISKIASKPLASKTLELKNFIDLEEII